MCKKTLGALFAVFIMFFFGCSKNQTIEKRANNMGQHELQAFAEFLGHDLLEGRAPGTRGGDLAEIYMRSMFKFMDMEPGWNKAYFQPFKMKGFMCKELEIKANGISLSFIDDVVGSFPVEKQNIELQGEAVFLGFGVKADTWNWDDYKNFDIDNKIVICRVNDPGMVNANIFEGDTLTYYGRWTYHIEEAARRGAKAVFLIHTDQSAGYDWNVVKNSWTGEELHIESDLQNKLQFAGWVKESSLQKVFKQNGLNLQKLYDQSTSHNFQPVETGVDLQISGKNKFREFTCNNVVAQIPGKTDKRIVLSAHIDHLGIAHGKAGDSIYNGAIDNGTAVAAMMMTAKILKEFQDQLHYSITILACNAEESGLLGSKYYAQNTNRENIVANINFESTPVWEKSKSIMGIGARFSSFENIIKKLTEERSLGYSEFSLSNQGLFYRSDQFSFAKYGIPSVWISASEDEVNGETTYTKFWSTEYHTVKDEYDSNWELAGMRQTIRYALLLVDYLNQQKQPPELNENLPFPVE